MNPTRILITFALMLTTAAVSYAIDPQQYNERERRMVRPPQLVAKPQPQFIPEHVKARQEQQRRENMPRQDSSSFRSPQSVNIDRLKVQSDTLAEYQFEQIQTLSIQDGDPSRTTEEKKEDPPEIAMEEQPQDQQPAEDVATTEPEPEETVALQEQIIRTSGGSSFKIIEESDRIIVMQVETATSPKSQAR